MTSRRKFIWGAGIAVGLSAGSGRAASVRRTTPLSGKLKPREVIGNFVTFYQEIPDEPRERYAGIWELSNAIIGTANSVLSQVPSIDEVSDLEDYGEPVVGLLRNVTENMAEVFGIEIETKYLDRAVRVTGYLPLIAQIWNLLQSSLRVLEIAGTKQRFIRKVRNTDLGKKAVKRFYIAVLLLVTELMFIWSGVGYRTAFGATRRVANVGLVRLRGQVGLRAYSVLLSIVHWLVRGSFETTVSYIVEKTGEVAQEFSVDSIDFPRLSPEDISNVLPQETSSPGFGFGIVGGLPFADRVESTADDVIDSSTKTLLLEQYGGAGIIDEKNTQSDGIDWDVW